MLSLKVWGGSTAQRKYARSLVRFSAYKLMSARLANTLHIKVSLIDKLMHKEGIFGDCIWEDHEYRPKEFKIRLDSRMKLRPLLETLAHEMVHVKQYARDEMKQLQSGVCRFNGEYLRGNVSYWDQPWEIEAHGRERGLFEMWRASEDIDAKWTLESLYRK